MRTVTAFLRAQTVEPALRQARLDWLAELRQQGLLQDVEHANSDMEHLRFAGVNRHELANLLMHDPWILEGLVRYDLRDEASEE